MPRLPTNKHPLFERRNAMILQAIKEERLKYSEIAEQFNLSAGRIAGIAQEYDVRRNGKIPQIADSWADEIVARAKSGEQIVTIASRFGRDRRTIMRLLRRNGVKPRPVGRPHVE